ncbi:MAG TPA: fumarylacetoacetate hydrolase family protein [Cyclobacteriaceae bacterium]|jgi:2,4-diketo-3-deoxy-L-fuconate hydrolase|nr:fumarylacetoacetate hydrolase family protein [Cytophagales bacterium]HNT50270.1 fumarylacetoacetate hydrolase family protein [Cyclobacteriaceae bacterium]HRE66898.1 fumarylacetoacetate hydrolase family protein [Cyclobacteriaceae bacterium]HRF34233.1 fumarylacetoacetate hydrolase family protein [Cyclobacteriaceae bacterium]
MKLFRFGAPGKEKPGVLVNDKLLDASGFGEDYGETFLETDGLTRLEKWVKTNLNVLPQISAGTRIGPCIQRPSKLICIGLNYTKHAFESKMPLPSEPIIFFKSTTALTGPNDGVLIPRNSTKTDYEIELAFIIGKKATYVEEKDAMEYVAGYCLHNDYSERAFQLERNGQWTKGKGCDTFAPLGPYFVTKDEVADFNNLHMWLKVNGKMMQDNNTDDMIFEIPFLVSYISQFMTLLPGDVISTGTPSGVGHGFHPPVYLKPGDVVELGIEGLGEQRQEVHGQ